MSHDHHFPSCLSVSLQCGAVGAPRCLRIRRSLTSRSLLFLAATPPSNHTYGLTAQLTQLTCLRQPDPGLQVLLNELFSGCLLDGLPYPSLHSLFSYTTPVMTSPPSRFLHSKVSPPFPPWPTPQATTQRLPITRTGKDAHMARYIFQTHSVLILSKTTLAPRNSTVIIQWVPTSHTLTKSCKT